MVAISFGDILIRSLKIWIQSNENLRRGIKDIDRFIEWERNGIRIRLDSLHEFYFKKYVFQDMEKYCDSFSKKLQEPVSQFLFDADFTEITLKVTYWNVGYTISNSIDAGPKQSLRIVR